MKSFLKNYYKELIFCFIFLLVDAIYIYSYRTEIGGQNTLIIFPLLLVSLVLMVLVFWLKNKKHLPLHRIFLFIAPVLGILYVVLMPLGVPPDETNHFRRAYEISTGAITSARDDEDNGGRVLPDSITVAMKHHDTETYPEMFSAFSSSTETTSESFQSFTNTSLYSPFSYLPEVVGIWLGRILHLPMFFIVYLARFFNLVFYIILVYYALKLLPSGKSALLLLAFSPIAIQSAASCQADALINGSVFAFSALIFYKIKNPTPLRKSEKIILTLLTFLIAMCKIVYLPLCFLVCLLPASCFHSKKQKIKFISILLCSVILANLIWLAISSGYLTHLNPGVNSVDQVKYILTHPIHYVATLVGTAIGNGFWYFTTSLGSSLGSLNISLSNTFIVFYGFFIIYAYLRENRNALVLNKAQKIFTSIILIVCVLLIFTSLYVQWTKVGSATIEGVQGRYFLPLLPIALLLFRPFATRSNTLSEFYPFILVISLNIYALSSFMSYYIA